MWVVPNDDSGVSSGTLKKINPSSQISFEQQADALVQSMRQKIRDLGGRSEDFWCADCVLSVLPRKTGER
jgi:hypothetical protein